MQKTPPYPTHHDLLSGSQLMISWGSSKFCDIWFGGIRERKITNVVFDKTADFIMCYCLLRPVNEAEAIVS